jgi:hypothetical protein
MRKPRLFVIFVFMGSVVKVRHKALLFALSRSSVVGAFGQNAIPKAPGTGRIRAADQDYDCGGGCVDRRTVISGV